MDVKLGMIADYANVSQDGKLNVMGIFSRILAPTFPASHPLLHLILVFSARAGEKGLDKEVRIRLLDGDGKSLMELNGHFPVPDAPGPMVELQQIFAIQMLQFPASGDYAFHILVNGETKATLPLAVEQTPPLGIGS